MRVSLRIAFFLLVFILVLSACSTPPPTPTPSALPATATSLPLPTTQATLKPTIVATPAGTLAGKFEVNGRSLYIECLGTGSPTIVLEPGEGGTHLDMKELEQRLAARTTTCAYDRANTGGLRTAKEVVNDLHSLLAAAKVPGPFVLVGTSAGGMFVQLYARTYPDQVVGVVAMNPVPPAHPWLDEVSAIFTAQEYADEKAYYGGNNGESFDYLTSSEQLGVAGAPPNVPFEMFLSTNAQCEGDAICLKSYSSYEHILQQVASTWSRGNFSQVKAGHEIYRDDIDAVLAVVKRVLASQ